MVGRVLFEQCFSEVDRDENAAMNIRDWAVISPGLVEATALFVPRPLGTGDSSDDGMTHHLKRACKTSSDTGRAWRGENDPQTSENEAQGKNLVKGASGE